MRTILYPHQGMSSLILKLVLVMSFACMAMMAQAQTLTSDQADYAPGTTATLTGSGFQAGETVTLLVLHYDGTSDGGADHQPWQVTADSLGNFVTTWHVCEDDCVGSTLRATADGQSSGLHAEAVFTDANTSLSNPTPTSAVYGSTITVSSTLTQQGGNGSCGSCVGNGNPIPSKTVNFSVNSGTSLGSGTTSSLGVATSTVSISLNVGSYTGVVTGLKADFAGDATPYASATNTVNFSVTKATTTISTSGSGVYGNSATLTANTNLNVSGISVSFSLDGTSLGTALTSSTGSVTIIVPFSSIPSTVKNAGTYLNKVSASIANTTNYTAASATGTFSISQRPITITADVKTKTYGNTDPALTAQITSGTIVSGDVASGSLSRAAGENVSSYAISKNTYTYGANYNETYVGANLSITTLAVTVTADAKSKTYGDVDPALTFVSSPAVGSSLANGQTISFTGSLSRAFCLTRAACNNVGSYLIGQGSVANSNYAISYVSANLSITQLAVTVTAGAKTKIYGQVDPPLTYSSIPSVGTVLAIGLDVGFAGVLSRVSGESATPPGTYAILQNTVNNANNPNYSITYVGANLTITALPVTVTADAKSKTYGTVADPAFTYTLSEPLLAGNSFTGALARTAGETVAGGPYAYNLGTLSAGTNYSLSLVGTNTFAITARPITVSADAGQSKVYGAADPVGGRVARGCLLAQKRHF